MKVKNDAWTLYLISVSQKNSQVPLLKYFSLDSAKYCAAIVKDCDLAAVFHALFHMDGDDK